MTPRGSARLTAASALILLAVLAPRGARAATQNVDIVNFAFQPSSTAIQVGDSVTWTWDSANGGTPHSTSSDPGSAVQWDSGIKSSGSFTVTFNKPGTFTYHCNVHPFMTGSITVQAMSSGTNTPTPTTLPTTATSTPPAGSTATPTSTASPVPASTATPTPTTVPTATPTSARVLHLAVAGKLTRGHDSTLHVSVTSNGKPVSGAAVTVDGRKAGMRPVRHAHTSTHGKATFHHLHPVRLGTVTVRASHSGYSGATKKLSVRR